MATPFDEKSVDWCVEFDLPIIKIASADSNDWMLLEKIADQEAVHRLASAGTPLKDMDDVVTFFENRNIPLAINHCVAAYPHEDGEFELNQIDFLRDRYPGHTIGYSSHEYKDWTLSVAIAYAKGARTFERHIDINSDGFKVAAYSSLPEQIDTWFKSFHKTVEFCGTARSSRQDSAAEGDGLPGFVHPRRLRQERPGRRPDADRERHLHGHPAAEGAVAPAAS